VSELPEGWAQIVLGEALQIQKGKKPNGLGPKGDDRLVPYINISAFETKLVEEYAPEQDVPRCEPSDTLLVWDGARAGLAGRGIGGFIGSTLARLTSDLAEPSYIYYFVHSNYGYLNTHTKGVGIPHIDPIVLAEITFPLPPLAEQTRIVAKLEELLSDLDAGVAELKAAQKKLGQYRQSLLKAAVEGALTAEWRAAQKVGAGDTAPETGAQLLARILTERRARWEAKQLAKFAEQGKTPPKDWQNKYPEPVRPNITDLPELPEGWVWASVDQIGEVTTGFTPSTANSDYFGGGVPFFKPTDLDAGYEVIKYRDSLTALGAAQGRLLPAKSILVTCIGATIGKTGLAHVACTTNQQINAISVSEEEIAPEFIYFVMTSWLGQKQIKDNASATTLPILNKSKFERLVVPIPSLNEQVAVIERLEERLSRVEDQEMAIGLSLKQSTAQRQNILRAAFAGQLVPQDPNDEPASVLLERIRKERAAQATPGKRTRRRQVEIA
jgi:type I restriction enzyme S subunit